MQRERECTNCPQCCPPTQKKRVTDDANITDLVDPLNPTIAQIFLRLTRIC